MQLLISLTILSLFFKVIFVKSLSPKTIASENFFSEVWFVPAVTLLNMDGFYFLVNRNFILLPSLQNPLISWNFYVTFDVSVFIILPVIGTMLTTMFDLIIFNPILPMHNLYSALCNCSGTVCFCCGAFCKVPLQTFNSPHRNAPFQRKIAVAL